MNPTISTVRQILLQLQAEHCAYSTPSSCVLAIPLPALLRFVFLRILPSMLLRVPSVLSVAVLATVGIEHRTFQSLLQYSVGR